MRKTRLFAFLCALVLMFSMLSFASADSHPSMQMKGVSSNRIGYENYYYTLKNGKTVSFYVHADYMSNLYLKGMTDWSDSYNDIIFDCNGKVTATCAAKWVHITETKGEFILYYDQNNTQKTRTATIQVEGNGYSAKFKLIQFGKNAFTSVVRNKKVVTFKFKLAAAAQSGYISVNMNKTAADGTNMSKSLRIDIPKGATSATCKVKAGWRYSFSLNGEYPVSKSYTISNSTDWVSFSELTAEDLTQKVKLR